MSEHGGPEPASPAPERRGPEDGDYEREQRVLALEYSFLTTMLATAWTASLTRTSIFIFTLSAAGVSLGFVAQGGLEEEGFRTVALAVLPIVLFVGITTFVRLVQLQRESIVYLAGLNRIRHFFQHYAPASAPYFVLPTSDDASALFKSPGTGMPLTAPKRPLLNFLAQTQGVVGAITAGVAGAIAGLAAAPLSPSTAAGAGFVAFLATIMALVFFWQGSVKQITASVMPVHPRHHQEGPSRR